MQMKRILIFMAMLCALLLLAAPASARTKVELKDCEIHVTIYLAFAFLDQGSQNKADDLMKTWKQNIESVWNNWGNNHTFGECKCPVKFKVEMEKLDAGKNCTDAPAGYHCVQVTDTPANQRGHVADMQVCPPDDNWNCYGDWTTGASGLDAAHEAGHMMGLQDAYQNQPQADGSVNQVNLEPQPAGQPQSIMAVASGDVTALQSHINSIVNAAGVKCPDRCCCGDGKIDKDKGEGCDPFATPNGCKANEFCCKECCQCHAPLCIPMLGEYYTQADCQKACPGGKCYYNYNTGCWDCIKGCTVMTPVVCSDPTGPTPEGCDYFPIPVVTLTAEDECEPSPPEMIVVVVEDAEPPPMTPEEAECQEQGSYLTREHCSSVCKENEQCLFNYKTGCWDCVPNNTQVTPMSCKQEERPEKCDFFIPKLETEEKFEPIDVIPEMSNDFVNWYNLNANFLPILSDTIYEERINVYIEDVGTFYALTHEGEIVEHGPEELPDQTLNIYTDEITVQQLVSGELGFDQALYEDRVIIEGVGLVNAIKFGFANLIFDILALFAPPTDITESGYK
jgi:hypothetical protein